MARVTAPKSSTPQAPGVWSVMDLGDLAETLESVETALQGIAAIDIVDVVLRINENVVTCHHDGLKWWVKFQ